MYLYYKNSTIPRLAPKITKALVILWMIRAVAINIVLRKQLNYSNIKKISWAYKKYLQVARFFFCIKIQIPKHFSNWVLKFF